ncbi:MAG: S8 family serine peptidase [Patescibacteria group bacterium]|nr:S8 family serine peptidase [Patescibacteria group bacterium]
MTRISERRRYGLRLARLEICESRELLSAVPAYDFWLDSEQIATPGLYSEVGTSATAAHTLTGLDQVLATYGFTGTGQTVAVIDTGIAYTHYALGGGYGSNYRVVGGWDFTKGVADSFDAGPNGSHGTHVAGIIGSSHGTYSGVASNVDLVGLRVFDDNGAGYFSWVEQALWWVHNNRFAFENPITAVNLSLGASYNAATVPSWAMLEDAFAQLEADGIFVSVAAGNDFGYYGTPGLSYPAVSPYVVPVGSVDANGSLSYFSQRLGRMIAAPGSYIVSTVPDYAGNNNGIQDDFGYMSGTSMAAPYVAGASVLLRQAYTFATGGTLNQDQLYDMMVNTADTFYDSATSQYYKRLNLKRAIDAIMPADDYGSTVATAHAMGTLSSSLGRTGHVSRLDDVDWFQFTAGTSGTVIVSATPNFDLVPKWQADGFSVSVAADGKSFSFNAVAGQTYRFSLATNHGVGHYTLGVRMNNPMPPSDLIDVHTGDFTGNGMTDIVGRASDGSWWVAANNGNGGYVNQRWTRWSTAVTWTDVMVGDFNGDGKDDIIGRVASTGDWWIAKSTGTGFVNEKWTRWSAAVNWTDVMVGDFNGDGKDDIIGRVASSGDWWIGNSTGTSFANQKWTRWSAAVTWVDVMVGDFNGDGKDDIIGRVASSGDWWIGSSTGTSFANQKWTRWSTGVTWVNVTAGDLNGDGRSDILGRVAGNGDWWAGRSNGSNAFVNERVGRWPAASLQTASSLGGSVATPSASVAISPLSTAQLGAVAHLLTPHDRPLAETSVPLGSAALERIDLIADVLRELDEPASSGHAEHRLLQSLMAARAAWRTGSGESGSGASGNGELNGELGSTDWGSTDWGSTESSEGEWPSWAALVDHAFRDAPARQRAG